jgi:divalent metal cation (Fe/Co/Zn/Cd) transporter
MQVNRRANSIIMLMVVMFVISALLQGFSATLYQSPTATAIAFGVVITASIVMELLTRARVELQARSLEFEG